MAMTRDGGGGSTASTAPSTLAGALGAINGAVAGAVAASGAFELVIDQGAITKIREHLVKALDILLAAQGLMGSIPASATGGSPYAAQLVHHSELANTHLLETINSIRTGLADFDSAMAGWLKDIESVDEQIFADLNQGRVNVESGTSGAGQR